MPEPKELARVWHRDIPIEVVELAPTIYEGVKLVIITPEFIRHFPRPDSPGHWQIRFVSGADIKKVYTHKVPYIVGTVEFVKRTVTIIPAANYAFIYKFMKALSEEKYRLLVPRRKLDDLKKVLDISYMKGTPPPPEVPRPKMPETPPPPPMFRDIQTIEHALKILNLPTATRSMLESIKKHLLAPYHPDKYDDPKAKAWAEAEFKRRNEAIEFLMKFLPEEKKLESFGFSGIFGRH